MLAKRANIQRIKEFSKSLQTYNKNTIAQNNSTNNKKGLSGAEAKEIEISQKYQESKCTYEYMPCTYCYITIIMY